MENISVLGCGTMGHSIALSAAWSGFDVRLFGMNEKDLETAEKGIGSKLSVMTENGLINRMEAEEITGRIHLTDRLEEAVAGRSFIIEAIPEDLELKQTFYKELESLIPDQTVVASNTSGLRPSDLAAGADRPERFVVTHFWNPAHLIPLVEVVAGRETSEETVGRAMALMKAMNKKPIEVKKELPGFIGNRLQYALFREAQYLIDQGVATKEDIDSAVTYSIGRRLPVTGPLKSADMGGLDVFKAISDYLFADLSNAPRSGETLSSLVDTGKLGSKSGEGFYLWDDGQSSSIHAEREKTLIDFLKNDLERGQ
ncbi:3-hydroxyacyl-CoA dehydrogenase family protein [Edaphobacillus lindanitolerans]|uniref:L-gulonate 3-dehydrogenase n=1 Tax=Edaphobacillus lindanitolerans TaxID=550447 RepID=A0A1U7PJ26_9BACI|nr:3-hydroxyacyl-CoA dehydrogenase NAD-binding domain-containing protein [Edaphobacillus lindanitolerans]SIT80069.1 3-hydroxybutyryl-CoA dehydrogenase [Edaphobacillus lindanitolerans]